MSQCDEGTHLCVVYLTQGVTVEVVVEAEDEGISTALQSRTELYREETREKDATSKDATLRGQ